jgi:hypothetical protein
MIVAKLIGESDGHVVSCEFDDEGRRHNFTRHPGRTSSPIRSGLSFRYTQVPIVAAYRGSKAFISYSTQDSAPMRRLNCPKPLDNSETA